MAPPVVTTPKGYTRGSVDTASPSAVATSLTRELGKMQRAQPNMRTVQLTEAYDVDPQDRTLLVDTTAGDVIITLRSAKQQIVLPLDIIKTSSDGNSVQVLAQSGESIGGPLGSLTGIVWAELGVGFSLHPDGLGQWWVEGSAVSWGSVGGLTSSAPDSIAAIADLVSGAANTFPYYTGTAAAALATLTAFARTLLDDVSAAAMLATLGIDTRLLTARASLVVTTASLANFAVESSVIAMANTTMGMMLLTADRACWVRFYGSAAAAAADLARAITTVGTAGTGLLADIRFTGAATVLVSPIAWLANEEVPENKQIFYTIQNRSGVTHTVQITAKVIPVEP